MSSNLVEQRAVLERELVRLEELLAPDQNWRKLALLKRVSAEDLEASVGQKIRAERERLQTALGSNRIYCARERILEALKIVQDEAKQTADFEEINLKRDVLPLTESVEQPFSKPSSHSAEEKSPPVSNSNELNVSVEEKKSELELESPNDDAHTPLNEPDEAFDPLEKIRGINAKLAELLNAQGVTRFQQIALWTHNDVKRISSALDLGRRISRENWIEQAALLSGTTGDTAVSRCRTEARHLNEAVEPDTTVDDLVARAAQSIAAQSSSHVRSASHDATPPRDANGIRISAFSKGHLASHDTVEVAADDLQKIHAIDDELAQRMIAAGVTRFEHVAALTHADVLRLNDELSLGTRIYREGWIEQAALLASGRSTANSRQGSVGISPRISMDDWARPVDPNNQREIPQFPIAVQAQTHCRRPPDVVLAHPPPDPIRPPPLPPQQAVTPVVSIDASNPPPVDHGEVGLQPELRQPLEISGFERPSDEHGLDPSIDVRHADEHSLTVESQNQLAVNEEGDDMGASDTNPAHRSLRARLKRAERVQPVDADRYAAYRGNIREASVEIVKPISDEDVEDDAVLTDDMIVDTAPNYEPDEPSWVQAIRELFQRLLGR